MTTLAIVATASLFALSPQEPEAAPPTAGAVGQGADPILDANSLRSLRKKLMERLTADSEYDEAEDRARRKAGTNRLKAKEAFQEEWEAKSKKGNILGSMADLRAIFDNCFEIDRPKSPGTLRPGKGNWAGQDFAYDYYLPKKYKPTTPVPTVLMLPSREEAGKWTEGRRLFEQTWKDTAALESTVFHLPRLPTDLEMDPVPDYTRDGQEALEQKRISEVLVSFGQCIRDVNVDRPRVFLDCAKGTSAFGVRFVSMFPDRFAGLILRHPTDVGGIRLGSLTGMPVFMIQTADNAQVVADLKQRLEAITPDSVTVLEATDDYPFKAAADPILEWMGKQRRTMTRGHVVIEPNHNRFNNAYWVQILSMNPIHTSAAENMPRIEVVADRPNNRVVITAQGISDFQLLLNDDLLDLDKEFTVVVNDKAVTEKKTRDLYALYKLLRQRRDWECLFPVSYTSSVPK